jgi:hypothetical protein
VVNPINVMLTQEEVATGKVMRRELKTLDR